MNIRILGRTNIPVGEIGIGCEGFVEKTAEQVREMVDVMETHGVNCIDLYSADPDMRDHVGQALEGRREKFVLQAHLCTVWEDGQYKRTRSIADMKASYQDLLRRLKTDYIDIGMIHYCDSMDDWNGIAQNGILDYAIELKNQGVIRHIGLSSHNPEVSLKAIETGLIDVLMFSVNPCYDLLPATEVVEDLWDEKNYANGRVNMDPQRQALYETCQRMGVAITVMKAFGGGDLLSEQYSPAGKALTVNQCLHYALTRPGVACVMSGARTIEELERSVAYETASDEERDYAGAFAQMDKISWHGHCMYCGHCAPCPKGISVADVTKFLNLAIAQGEVPETVREHYAVLPHHAGECIQCGACEKRCPFGVPIMANMKKAAEVFGR